MAKYWTDGMELYHYGIPGQKWGQRRYQNPDGTLTTEGMQRYGRMARRHERRAKNYEHVSKLYKNRGIKASLNAAANRERKIADNWRKGDIFTKNSSATTQRVLADYRNLSNKDFFSKYKTTRREYANRVKKYGDPHVYRTTGKYVTEDVRNANIEQLYGKGKNSKRY